MRTPQEYAEIAAKETGLNTAKFLKLIRCESNWDITALGDNKTSTGILQFKKTTFDLFAKKYSLPDADINDPYHQIELAAWMIRDGYLYHWKNCARRIEW